ncbi:hypothetical protein [Saccharolobus solfataricus]|uniref:Uncharacterized protein n=2 Tax=Saccharolobus solfataricus TaxID=2287 RepID=A0A7S9IHU9_SACSO|nr:hypothetical protein [Saccharolobus solfataricus]QPG49435.1 hypothetical protein HFC64_06055 [Saccharolobus solfataricus]
MIIFPIPLKLDKVMDDITDNEPSVVIIVSKSIPEPPLSLFPVTSKLYD